MINRRALLAALATGLLPQTVRAAAGSGRIVVAGGALTEIVVALGAASRIAGVDTTSLYPHAIVDRLPRIGYLRTLSAEGILSLDPALLLASDQAGPPGLVGQLRRAGLRVVLVPEIHEAGAIAGKVAAVADAIGETGAGGAMTLAITADLAALSAAVAQLPRRPRVLFVMSASNGRIMAAGRETAADLMLELAGGTNVANAYSGYKPVTAEAAMAADPEIIILPRHSVDALGGMAGVAALPALAPTAAVSNGRVHTMDTLYLLGLGPRIAHAGRDLAVLLHPGAVLPGLPERRWTAGE
ncbi:ABC transporter substrate-binding protein [Ferrovibrio sp.]|uniref:heme/hemin ABC transporter substrate-binding protein n=1 Tax=Ferrovibrio sp. TaxID=1917215 RepID=UPI00311E4667